MSTLRAVVFTRPYPIGLGDYTFFVRPAEFATDRKYFDDHIRNVLHEDDSATIGSIRGRRWHVLRRGNIVVVGMATNEFGRRDESGRAIRGYYGFAMPANDVALPSGSLFKALDKICVEPVFMQAPVRTKDANPLTGGPFDDVALCKKAVDSRKWCFNTDPNRIRCHCCDEVSSILSSALVAASQNSEFEIVIGLNTIEHAQRIPILNCVCHAVSTTKDIPSAEPKVVIEDIPTQKEGQSDSRRNPVKIPIGVSPKEPSPTRKQSFLQKIFHRNVEQNVAPAPSDSTIHSKSAEFSHKMSARSLLEQGFGHNGSEKDDRVLQRSGVGVSPSPTVAREGCDSLSNKGHLDAHIEETPADAAQAQKSVTTLDADGQMIAVLEDIARLQDEINEMKREANDGFSLMLGRIETRLDEIMERGGALPIDGEGVFDVRRHSPVPMSTVKDGTLIEKTTRAGWCIGDRVLRRALVTL